MSEAVYFLPQNSGQVNKELQNAINLLSIAQNERNRINMQNDQAELAHKAGTLFHSQIAFEQSLNKAYGKGAFETLQP